MKNLKGKMTKNHVGKDKIVESTIHICELKLFYESLDKQMRHVSTQMRKNK